MLASADNAYRGRIYDVPNRNSAGVLAKASPLTALATTNPMVSTRDHRPRPDQAARRPHADESRAPPDVNQKPAASATVGQRIILAWPYGLLRAPGMSGVVLTSMQMSSLLSESTARRRV
jgi:hypothetical protein